VAEQDDKVKRKSACNGGTSGSKLLYTGIAGDEDISQSKFAGTAEEEDKSQRKSVEAEEYKSEPTSDSESAGGKKEPCV
jgi:hypothetical protein